ncbi:MAG TPA: type II toxin-antitoxin system RelE/ParE family toxin [Cytophagales bacterium]|nr:type II toxin-antitoxin system RelE/ParE family toxin [Cytophagales bacterium]
MEQRKIEITETAYADLEDIESYISNDSPRIARKFIERIFARLEQLYEQPESGRMVPEFENKEIRELILK